MCFTYLISFKVTEAIIIVFQVIFIIVFAFILNLKMLIPWLFSLKVQP